MRTSPQNTLSFPGRNQASYRNLGKGTSHVALKHLQVSPPVCLSLSCFNKIDIRFAEQLIFGSQATLRNPAPHSMVPEQGLGEPKGAPAQPLSICYCEPSLLSICQEPGARARAESGPRGKYSVALAYLVLSSQRLGHTLSCNPQPCPRRHHGICDSGVQHTCIRKPWFYWGLTAC